MPDRPEVSLSVDVLAPEGYGEIIGGGQRLDDYDLLLQRIEEHKLPREAFEWYLDLRRFGSVPHARLRHGHRARRLVDLRPRSPARGDSVSADAVQAVSVNREASSVARRQVRDACELKPSNCHESRFRLPRLSEEPRRRRGDAGPRARGRARDHAGRARRPRSSSSTPARSSTRPKKNRSTRSSRWRSSSATAAASGSSSPAASASAIAISSRRRFRRSTSCSARAKCRRSSARSNGRPADGRRPFSFFKSRDASCDESPNARSPGASNTGRTLPTYLYDASTPRLLTTPRHYAYVKIAEGCDYTCAFCIIPTLRGKYRSRDEDSIVREAERLAARRRARAAADLAGHDVLRHRSRRARRAGAAAAPAERGRRASSGFGCSTSTRRRSPTTCSTRWRSARRSASTSTCRCSTRRPTCCAGCGGRATARRTTSCSRASARACPDVTLRTTFIVGFPGETEQDFDELAAFVRDTGFDHVGVFTYSHEEDTRAFAMDDDVPADGQGARGATGSCGCRSRSSRARQKARRRRRRPRHGGRPVARVAAGAAGPPRGPGADIDSVVVSRRVRPVGDCAPDSVVDARRLRARAATIWSRRRWPGRSPAAVCYTFEWS